MILDVHRLLNRFAVNPPRLELVDVSATPDVPLSHEEDRPRALGPYLQLVVPFALDGEPGVLDYRGEWTVSAVCAFISAASEKLPVELKEAAEESDVETHNLADCLFASQFVDGSL
eukprot:Selendium_serpulae@DN2855_c1_g1_i1.p2